MLSSIRKIDLTHGLSWVEIPELGFNLLCGCPADSVKHLMRRGLIQNQQVNGIKFETGPHAILLSDLSVQNGQFSNMAEFPVLQMMYRQGMILPNHPGNTGKKPLLIGSQEQISNQMQYIYRGNYGLVSPEEIMEAGISPEEAKRMMALKLKFAFGKIKHPGELLSTLVIDFKKVNLLPNLTLERLGTNIFELKYGEEVVNIDLNLKPGQNYAIPYALHHHNIRREYFSVIHSGEGDGWDIHRPSMSSIIVFQGKYFLIDAGPNIHHILKHLGIGINEIYGIFHTHSHDDHFSGLTTLMRTDRRIRYYSTPLVRSCVMKKLTALLSIDQEDFHHYFETVDLVFDEWNDIEGLEVRPIFSPHPVETNIFEFRTLWEGGHLSFSHLADITSRKVLDGMIDEANGITQEWVQIIYDHYLRTHDLKKLDIGGGMIHGQAADFKGDQSRKIILAHTALDLNPEQMEIGSGAPFGTTDVLIKSNFDVRLSHALGYLETYFPQAPAHELNVLLNFPIKVFNPQTIMLKGGASNDYIYLVLTGNVNMIDADTDLYCTLSSGAILGEFSGMIGVDLDETYRAESFVQALQIPSQLYYAFVKKNNLYHSIEELSDKRWFLQRTWLFGESISTPIQNSIAMHSIQRNLRAGKVEMPDAQQYLVMIQSGSARLCLKDKVYRSLGVGDFFGEEVSIFNSTPLLDVIAETELEVYLIPRAIISEIPIVRFKLHETYEMKVSFLFNSGWDQSRLDIVEGQEVGHHQIDILHRKLHIMAMRTVDLIEGQAPRNLIQLSLEFIAITSKKHFEQEEHWMEIYNLDSLERHRQAHVELLNTFKNHVNCDEEFLSNGSEALQFFKAWLLDHHLEFDQKLAIELNGRGIY
jgi:hemerythrin